MSFVFISYARADSELAKAIASALSAIGLEVFWDQRIRAGADFRFAIDSHLSAAACVLVLWTRNSVESDWVSYEAEFGRQQKKLIQVALEDVQPPPPFGARSNLAVLSRWRGASTSPKLSPVVQAVAAMVRPKQCAIEDYSLTPPRRGKPLTDTHIALIHTCWRRSDLDSRFGGTPAYRWDMALYGSRQALDRVRSVVYLMHPAYERPNATPPSSSIETRAGSKARKDCFRIRQVASGHSLVRAYVSVEGQLEQVILSRYVNLFDSDYRIDDYFV